MKGPYQEGKRRGKLHPSPGPSANSSSGDVSSALRLLPADILAQTVALGERDKEVLAYHITRSMKCHVAARAVYPHRPMIGCDCFECYKSFWSRWNSSADKGIFDQVIDAFEEHLARVEKEKTDKMTAKEGKKKKTMKRSQNVVVVENVPEESGEVEEKVPEEEAAAVSGENEEPETMGDQEDTEKVLEEVEEGSDDNDNSADEAAVSGGGETRKSWVDFMGIFNFRFFGA